jgi:hypothetical protein
MKQPFLKPMQRRQIGEAAARLGAPEKTQCVSAARVGSPARRRQPAAKRRRRRGGGQISWPECIQSANWHRFGDRRVGSAEVAETARDQLDLAKTVRRKAVSTPERETSALPSHQRDPLAHPASIQHHPSRGLNAFSKIVQRLGQIFMHRDLSRTAITHLL